MSNKMAGCLMQSFDSYRLNVGTNFPLSALASDCGLKWLSYGSQDIFLMMFHLTLIRFRFHPVKSHRIYMKLYFYNLPCYNYPSSFHSWNPSSWNLAVKSSLIIHMSLMKSIYEWSILHLRQFLHTAGWIFVPVCGLYSI
jgi:hypothetical protein